MLWQRSSSLMVHQYFRKISMSCRSYTTKVGSLSAKNVSTPEASTAKDLILYKFESPRFFKFLNIFAITQYSVWMFISVSSMSMIDVPVPEMTKKEEEDAPFWKKINLGSDKYKYGLALGSAIMGTFQKSYYNSTPAGAISTNQADIFLILFILGFGILCASWLYTLRSVRYLVLRKDAKTVSFVTYAPFGRNRIMEVPIANVGTKCNFNYECAFKSKFLWF